MGPHAGAKARGFAAASRYYLFSRPNIIFAKIFLAKFISEYSPINNDAPQHALLAHLPKQDDLTSGSGSGVTSAGPPHKAPLQHGFNDHLRIVRIREVVVNPGHHVIHRIRREVPLDNFSDQRSNVHNALLYRTRRTSQGAVPTQPGRPIKNVRVVNRRQRRDARGVFEEELYREVTGPQTGVTVVV
jgi:hypothetical protein